MKNARPGVTLLETVIAFSLLSGVLLVVTGLIDTGLGHSRDSRTATLATVVARSRLAEVRSWLQGDSQAKYAFDRWSSFPELGAWRQEGSWPGFESKTELAPHLTFTPAAGSELLFDPVDRRPVAKTLLKATIEVRWGGRLPRLQVVTLIADGRRAWGDLTISGAGGSVARGAVVNLSAKGFDDLGQEIPDLTLSWSVMPATSCGMILDQSRDGRTARFCHQVPKPFGPGFNFAPPGTAWVAVSGRLWGVEKTSRVLVNLQ